MPFYKEKYVQASRPLIPNEKRLAFYLKKKNAVEIISMVIRTFDASMARVRAIKEKAGELCQQQEDIGLKKWLDN